MISALALAFLCAGPLRADGPSAPAEQGLTQTAAQAAAASPTAQDLSPSAAGGDDAQEGIYYGPDPDAKGATDGDASLAQAGSYLSHARITAFAWGAPKRELTGAEVVLNGDYQGVSPLQLKGLLASGGAPAKLALRLDGYSEGLRPAVVLPEEGELRVALLDDNAGSWISTPGWVTGLGLMAASVLAYRSESSQVGLGLAGSGIAVIAVGQLLVRWALLPALRRAVRAFNGRPEAAPQP